MLRPHSNTNTHTKKATQFVVLLERGKGDSVKEIAAYWGDTDIHEIYNRVMEWKAQQQPGHPVERPAIA